MSEEIKEIVKRTYTEALNNDSGCCDPTCCTPTQDVNFNESYLNIEGYEQDADYALGCGIPTEFAKIKEELRSELLRWMKECGDKGQETEMEAFKHMPKHNK